MRQKLIAWGLPAALGIAAYAIGRSIGMPEWAGFPVILIGAMAGTASISWRRRRGGGPTRRGES